MGALARIVPKPRGTYNSSTVYNTLDIVRYTNKVWMCRQDNVQGITPSEGVNWMFLVQDGDGGGAEFFSELDDVSVSNPQDHQIPVYDDNSSTWMNKNLASAFRGYEHPSGSPASGNYMIELAGWSINAQANIQSVLSLSINVADVPKFKGIIPLGARLWWSSGGDSNNLIVGVMSYVVNDNGDVRLGLIGRNPYSDSLNITKIYLAGILV